MRLPGTFNLGGRNRLPTAEFLIHYDNLKRAKAQAKLEREANGNYEAEFGEKPLPKRVTSTSKKEGDDVKKDEKPGDVVLTPDGETFSPLQDSQLIKMKIEGKSWNDIATELGKDHDALKKRFKEVQPSDWEAQAKEWKQNNNGGGGKKNQKNQNDQNENKENQNQGGKGNNNNNNNQNQNQNQNNQNNQNNNNKNKNKNNKQDNQNNKIQNWNKKEEAQAEAGAEDDDVSDAGTWAVADENFTEKEVSLPLLSHSHHVLLEFSRTDTRFLGHRPRKDRRNRTPQCLRPNLKVLCCTPGRQKSSS